MNSASAGCIEGVDLNTGKQLWRTHTIPGPGEPGGETWKDGKERYKHGGGSVWETATYDPETDTFYQGIGNAGPDWDAEYRPGDNKWAASVLALSPTDGKIKWGFQYTPQDPYDFDEISEHPIINAKVNGVDRKLVVHAARNGFYYALDRTNGSFVLGKQYVDQLNWTTGLDPKTGRPLNYNPNMDVQEYSAGQPRLARQAGGRPSLPIALRRQELGAQRLQSRAQSAVHSIVRGLQFPRTRSSRRISSTRADRSSRASASRAAVSSRANVSTAASRRSIRPRARPRPICGSNIRTAAARSRPPATLVFIGHADGTLTAHDAKTLKEVWSYNVGSGINAPPISYSVNGKQYVAVLVGSKQPFFVLQNAPELKNSATASILCSALADYATRAAETRRPIDRIAARR